MAAEWILLLGGVLLAFGTGVFVASEFALVTLDRAELEARAERGEPRLAATISALKTTSTHLSSAQLGITLTTLLSGFMMEPALTALLTVPLTAAGLPTGFVVAVSAVVSVAIATLISMIFGELVPKNFALALPLRAAQSVIPIQIAFTRVFWPFVIALNRSANGVLRLFGIEPHEELSGARSAEELTSLVRRSASAGLLEADTATLLSRTLTFSSRTAADVMTPRPRVATVRSTDTVDDVIALTQRTGFSRFPVVETDIDDVIGVVHVKHAIAIPRSDRSGVPVSDLTTPPLRVPETMHLDSLLQELRARGYQMAVVVDEYGGTAGLATLEDLVEEIVGEVADEHDRARVGIIRGRLSTTFPGSLRPDELSDRAGIVVPDDGPYETVAGFVMNELGRLPRLGDEVAISDGILRVERMDGRRVDRIRFTPRAEETHHE